MNIGKKIRDRLTALDMTQRELADRCDITEVAMSRYVTNTRIPKTLILKRIARELCVTMDYLTEDEDED